MDLSNIKFNRVIPLPADIAVAKTVATTKLTLFTAAKPNVRRQVREQWIITEADRSATTVLLPDEY